MNDEELHKVIVAFGLKVKNLRHQHKMTQVDLAVKIGLDSRQLMRIENGQTNTSLTVVYLLAKTFGVSVGELF